MQIPPTDLELKLGKAFEILARIDGSLLKRQRLLMNNLVFKERLRKPERELMHGLIDLVDALADYRTDYLGDHTCQLTEED